MLTKFQREDLDQRPEPEDWKPLNHVERADWYDLASGIVAWIIVAFAALAAWHWLPIVWRYFR